MWASQKKSTSKVTFSVYVCNKTCLVSQRVMWGVSSKTAQNRWPQGRRHFDMFAVIVQLRLRSKTRIQGLTMRRQLADYKSRLILKFLVKNPNEMTRSQLAAETANLLREFHVSQGCLQGFRQNKFCCLTFNMYLLPALFFVFVLLVVSRFHIFDTSAMPSSSACVQNGFVYF